MYHQIHEDKLKVIRNSVRIYCAFLYYTYPWGTDGRIEDT